MENERISELEKGILRIRSRVIEEMYRDLVKGGENFRKEKLKELDSCDCVLLLLEKEKGG